MATHHRARIKIWAGLALLVLGAAAMAIADPAGAGTDDSGNLRCDQILDGLELTDIVTVKDDHQRVAPFPAQGVGADFHTFTSNGVTVSYRFIADPAGDDGFVVEFKDASAPIYGFLVKQASDAQGLSRSGQFPDGVTAGTIPFPVGEFSHLDFCTGGNGSTTTEDTTTTTEDTTTTTEDTTTTTEDTTTTTEDTTTTSEDTTTTTTVDDDTTTTEAETTTTVDDTTTTVSADVDDDEETTTTAARIEPEVLRDVVVRDLPRTGAPGQALALIGAAMMIVGAVLVGLTGRRLVDHAEKTAS